MMGLGVSETYVDAFCVRVPKSVLARHHTDFSPKNLGERIGKNELITSTDAIRLRIQQKGLKSRFSDIRENHATLMTKLLSLNEIDFLHGRVTGSVFMKNYFNPSLIDNLKKRGLTGICEIQQKLLLDNSAFLMV